MENTDNRIRDLESQVRKLAQDVDDLKRSVREMPATIAKGMAKGRQLGS